MVTFAEDKSTVKVLLFLHFELNADDGLEFPLQFFSLDRVLQPWVLCPGCVEQFWGEGQGRTRRDLYRSPHTLQVGLVAPIKGSPEGCAIASAFF